MTLAEKIEKAKTCQNFAPFRTGSCKIDGYAPFDCEFCDAYKKLKKEETPNEMSKLRV